MCGPAPAHLLAFTALLVRFGTLELKKKHKVKVGYTRVCPSHLFSFSLLCVLRSGLTSCHGGWVYTHTFLMKVLGVLRVISVSFLCVQVWAHEL